MNGAVLLMSGGLDSTALAARIKPAACLTIDYGQRPADGERTASALICADLGISHVTISVDCGAIGSGLLADGKPGGGPSPEWWPYRNQLLATIGAAWAIQNDLTQVLLGTVSTDAERHLDGTPNFYSHLDRLVSYQEGAIRVEAPAIGMTTEELVARSGIDITTLAWTHSCHVANLSCGACPGCQKRTRVLNSLGAG
jgi:7-cyano-7-deazaguanine synthase